ncbi:hypothetical protein MJH54_33895, partial [Salmonella enterica subsp. enterica serovar Montevideo]|nr:hypothetical protein [Salmonella enterica subsp. enterica serovar Montevideo]
NRVLKGTVDSVAAGVTNASSTSDAKGMATIDSNLEWVRLAQRAGTGDSHIAFASPDENRAVLAAWIGAESKRAGEIHPAADNNW